MLQRDNATEPYLQVLAYNPCLSLCCAARGAGSGTNALALTRLQVLEALLRHGAAVPSPPHPRPARPQREA